MNGRDAVLRFRDAVRRELAFITGSRPMLAALFLVPACSILLIAAMLSRGSIDALPVAVVDEAQTDSSRAVVRLLAARPELHLTSAPTSVTAAEAEMRSGRIWAYAQLPKGFGEGSPIAGEPVRIFYNATYLSVGSMLERGFRAALRGAMIDSLRDQTRRTGLDIGKAAVPQIQVSVLFNPQASFEWFLQALVQPAMMHLLAACVGVFAMARELGGDDGRSFAEWHRQTGGGIPALLGKLTPYLVVLAWWGAAWMIWLIGIRGWRMEGSLLATWCAQTTLLVASLAISFALVSALRKDVVAYSVCALYAGSALAYSGGSLPIEGAPTLARWWHWALPFTHYLSAQMDQFIGAPSVFAWRTVGLLGLYALAGLAFATLAAREKQSA